MKIIGVGFGRTGTFATKKALERLGYRCYHMYELEQRPSTFKIWLDAFDGKMPPDWDVIFKDFDACLDFPACMFYKELLERYPDAKVLLNARDPEKWYNSVLQTIYPYTHSILYRFTQLLNFREMYNNYMIRKIIFEKIFKNRFTNKSYAIQVYNDHIRAVKEYVQPANRLLVFDVAQGWKPLCTFLDEPVPLNEPFPNLNNVAEFHKTNRMEASYIHIKIVLCFLFILGVFYLFNIQ